MRKKKATAQRRRQVNVERVRRGPLGFLHVARGEYCDRIEGWYSRMPQNQLPLSGCYSWPTKCAPSASLPGGQQCCVVLWPSKGRIQYQALRSARIGRDREHAVHSMGCGWKFISPLTLSLCPSLTLLSPVLLTPLLLPLSFPHLLVCPSSLTVPWWNMGSNSNAHSCQHRFS